MQKHHIILWAFLAFPLWLYAAGEDDDVYIDTIYIAKSDSANIVDDAEQTRFYQRGLIGKVYDYLNNANQRPKDKKFDISFIGGPHYSSEEGFGIGLAGSGSYRAGDFNNKSTPRSNVTLKLDVTTGQLYKISAQGYHIFERDRYRINYDVYFYSFADKWWGIGYVQNSNDKNECKYKRFQSQASANFVWQLHPGVFAGPAALFSYVNARDFSFHFFDGDEVNRVLSLGIGATFMIDTRNIPTGASRGVYLRTDIMSCPTWLAHNKDEFYTFEVDASTYAKVWQGGVLAMNAHSRLTWGDTPWCLMSTFGGSYRMRGYWEGRYRDKMEGDFTVELRQHIWDRHGIAVWGGAGQVFPRLDKIRLRHTLPTYGIGYRWEFKRGVNVRLDVGFGKNGHSINFSLNEAF